jgi:cation diffusion facilitator family transporter
MSTEASHTHHDHTHHHHHEVHEGKTKLVVGITAVAMTVEITAGYITNSMALLSDGWHMSSHVMAIGLTWFGYAFAKRHKANSKFKNGTEKVLSLSGYSSAIILMVVAVLMLIESFQRIYHPENIHFKEALIISVIGLIVNILCAKILHHEEDHSDHNIRAAYLHVLADAVTSIFAIIALVLGIVYNIVWLDAVSGIIGSIVIVKWAYGLILQSGKTLLDYSHE